MNEEMKTSTIDGMPKGMPPKTRFDIKTLGRYIPEHSN